MYFLSFGWNFLNIFFSIYYKRKYETLLFNFNLIENIFCSLSNQLLFKKKAKLQKPFNKKGNFVKSAVRESNKNCGSSSINLFKSWLDRWKGLWNSKSDYYTRYSLSYRVIYQLSVFVFNCLLLKNLVDYLQNIKRNFFLFLNHKITF